MLSPPRWRRAASWICGWAYVVGNITITLAVNFGTTLFFVSCINVFESEPGVGIFAGEPYQVYLIFLGITLFTNAVSALGNKWLPWLDVSIHFPWLQQQQQQHIPPSHTHTLTLLPDCCHLLDFCRRLRHHHLRPRRRQGGPSQCRMGLYSL